LDRPSFLVEPRGVKRDFKRLIDLVKWELGFGPEVTPLSDTEESVWRLARLHKLGTILAPKILELKSPAGLIDEARYIWQLAALRQEYYVRKCTEILALLQVDGIEARPLKGVELARSYYPKPGFRVFRDVDLLVAPENLASAHVLLRSHGFVELKPKGPLPRAVAPRGNVLAAVECGLDAVSYAKDDLFLEVHTHLLLPMLGKYPIDRTWSPADTFVHLAFHTTRHHFLYGLRHLIDLALVARAADLSEVEEKLRRTELFWLAWPAWKLTSEVFPEIVIEPPLCDSKWLSAYTNVVRRNLSSMPEKSIPLSGSPLPFVFAKKNLLKVIKGSESLSRYQLGDETSKWKSWSWRMGRPVGLAWRHAPILWNWLKFSIASSV
jgi:hypothetical protein